MGVQGVLPNLQAKFSFREYLSWFEAEQTSRKKRLRAFFFLEQRNVAIFSFFFSILFLFCFYFLYLLCQDNNQFAKVFGISETSSALMNPFYCITSKNNNITSKSLNKSTFCKR